MLHDWNVNLSRGGQNKSQDATQKLLRLKNSSRHFILQENEKLAPTKGPLKPKGDSKLCVDTLVLGPGSISWDFFLFFWRG